MLVPRRTHHVPNWTLTYVLCIVFPILSFLVLAVRFYVRATMVKIIGPDDWIMLAAWIWFALFNGCCCAAFSNGAGKHLTEITSVSELNMALKLYLFAELTYIVSQGLIKVSAGALIIRITAHKRFKGILYFTILLTIVVNVAIFFVMLFQCNPVSAWWHYTEHITKCIDTETVILPILYAQSGVNTATDFVFATLPIIMVWNLNLKRSVKIGVAGILALVLLNAVATLIRIIYLIDLAGNTDDFLYPVTGIALWSSIEICVGIIAASLPPLRPLMARYLEKSGILSSRGDFGNSGTCNRSRGHWNSKGYMNQETLVDNTKDIQLTTNAVAIGRTESSENITRPDQQSDQSFSGNQRDDQGIMKSVSFSRTEQKVRESV